jgi:hypothetical protein
MASYKIMKPVKKIDQSFFIAGFSGFVCLHSQGAEQFSVK